MFFRKIHILIPVVMLPAFFFYTDSHAQNNANNSVIANIGISHLQEFLQQDSLEGQILKTLSGTTLIIPSTELRSQRVIKNDLNVANALALDFDQNGILSTIRLIRIDK